MMVDHPVRTESTSRSTANAQPIVLRQTDTRRLCFLPTLVDNPHSKEASIRGHFVYQRKTWSGDWVDHSELKLSDLKAEEWIKLELRSQEVFTLMTELSSLYGLVADHGIPRGTKTFLPAPQSSVLKDLLQKEDELQRILKDEDPDILNLFDIILGAAKLRTFLAEYDNNSQNPSEAYWHALFKGNSWVLSQLFAYPVVIIDDQAYVGGKTLSNKGGNVVDFAYKNEITSGIALVEIKTPTSDLMAARPYRAPNVFAASSELSGATVQLLTSKSSLLAESDILSRGPQEFAAFNPECLLLVGSLSRLSGDRLRSFELYRRGLRDVQIITFDELRRKLGSLLTLLQAAQS